MIRWNELASLVTAAAAVTALVAGYVQFVLRRAIYPCVEFDVDFILLRIDVAQKVGDIVLTIKNVGPGAGNVIDVQGRVRYSLAGETDVGKDGIEPGFGHLVQSQQTATESKPQWIIQRGGFLFSPNWQRAFIQPGVTQIYRKPLAVPSDAVLIHVWAAFNYHIPVGRIRRWLAKILIHHQKMPEQLKYTVRRTFTLDRAP
jgi:hypothetical protein